MSAGSSNGRFVFSKAALIGTGLIGGSIGMALREKGLVGEISGYDQDAESCRRAVELGALDKAAPSVEAAVEDADLVIIAVPVSIIAELLKNLMPSIKPGAIVTDTGSTKGAIMAAVEEALPAGLFFIGGHPMAGSEESGISGADPALLENAIYVLTPLADTPDEHILRLTGMIERTGAQPIILDPFLHDRVVASVSHLPHIAAAALVQSVAGFDDPELVRTLAAGGFRDSTRIAMGNPDLWRDICMSNRWALLAALKRFKQNLDALEKFLSDPNAEAVKEYLLQARDYRKDIPYRGRGILPDLFELIVLVRDEPGVLGRLTGLLGEADINIDAIEIIHVRELAGGSIRLGFRSSDQQERARYVLEERGYNTCSPAD